MKPQFVARNSRWVRTVRADGQVLDLDARIAADLAWKHWAGDRVAWKQTDMAAYYGRSLSTIKRAIRRLVDAGYLKITEVGHRGWQQLYRLVFPGGKGVTGATPSFRGLSKNHRAGVPDSPDVPGRASAQPTRPPVQERVHRPHPDRRRIIDGREVSA